MTQQEIPKNVLRKARQRGFNSVTFEGRLEGVDVYSVAVLDAAGVPTPIGLPTFITDDGNSLSILSGKEGFDLMLRL